MVDRSYTAYSSKKSETKPYGVHPTRAALRSWLCARHVVGGGVAYAAGALTKRIRTRQACKRQEYRSKYLRSGRGRTSSHR